MVSGKGIVSIVVTLVSIFSLIGYLDYTNTMIQDSSRLSQGDPNAANDMSKNTADFISGELYWDVGLVVAIAIFSALGLGVLVTILKRL